MIENHSKNISRIINSTDKNSEIEYYDFVIIGGGLAGITLGFLLKKNNKKVLIIETKKNCQKLCGGILSKKSYDLIVNIFGEKIINKLDLIKYDSCTVKDNGNILNLKCDSFICDREKLNLILREQYLLLNGELIIGQTYKSIDFSNSSLELNHGKRIRYKYIIGADGVNSKLRFSLLQKSQNKNFALELKKKNSDKNKLELHFFDDFAGYGWIIPNSLNTVIGIGNVNGNVNIKDNFIKFVNMECYESTDDLKGAFLPTGDDFLFNKNNIFFIGDAAGLIDPITGEGIYYAMYSAYVLSNNCNDYKTNMKKIKKKIKKRLVLKKFIYNTKLRNYLFFRYNKSPLIKGLIDKFLIKLLM